MLRAISESHRRSGYLNGNFIRLGVGQSFFCWPTPQRNSFVKRLPVDPKKLGPFDKRHGLPVPCQSDCFSLVPGLIDARGPNAVSRFIVPVVVFALNLVIRTRAAAHVRDEAGESVRRLPSVTDRDPSSSIIRIACGGRIEASSLEAAPYLIFRNLVAGAVVFSG